MRLDIFLKISRLARSRTVSQDLCDAGLVGLNGNIARSAKEVRVGDVIRIRKKNRILEVRVSSLPRQKQVSKENAADLYTVLSETPVKDLLE